jgi:CBS domain containing-hemolysin-like protein
VSGSASADSLTEVIASHGHSHYPVVGERVDDLIGVVGLRELILLDPRQAARTTIRELARPAVMVPSSLALPNVVEHMRLGDEEVACVVDEYGGFAGLVTWEDVAEELVGEISDETDEDEPLATRQQGWWLIDAGLRVDEVGDLTGVELPQGDYDTVAGLLLERLGRVAETGDTVAVELPVCGPDGLPRRADIEVLTIDRHVPERIRLRTAEEAPAASHAGDEPREAE